MDIAAFKERAGRLQNELREAIEPLVEEFQKETGVGVASVSVPMLDISTHGEATARYAVGNVSISVDILRVLYGS